MTNAVLPTWVLEADVNSCFGCEVELTWHRWGYHCRLCGNLFCKKCCNKKKQLPTRRHWVPGDPDKTIKCCNVCVNVLENCLAFGATAQPRPRPRGPDGDPNWKWAKELFCYLCPYESGSAFACCTLHAFARQRSANIETQWYRRKHRVKLYKCTLSGMLQMWCYPA